MIKRKKAEPPKPVPKIHEVKRLSKEAQEQIVNAICYRLHNILDEGISMDDGLPDYQGRDDLREMAVLAEIAIAIGENKLVLIGEQVEKR